MTEFSYKSFQRMMFISALIFISTAAFGTEGIIKWVSKIALIVLISGAIYYFLMKRTVSVLDNEIILYYKLPLSKEELWKEKIPFSSIVKISLSRTRPNKWISYCILSKNKQGYKETWLSTPSVADVESAMEKYRVWKALGENGMARND